VKLQDHKFTLPTGSASICRDPKTGLQKTS
jgi:hypothetical protein